MNQKLIEWMAVIFLLWLMLLITGAILFGIWAWLG